MGDARSGPQALDHERRLPRQRHGPHPRQSPAPQWPRPQAPSGRAARRTGPAGTPERVMRPAGQRPPCCGARPARRPERHGWPGALPGKPHGRLPVGDGPPCIALPGHLQDAPPGPAPASQASGQVLSTAPASLDRQPRPEVPLLRRSSCHAAPDGGDIAPRHALAARFGGVLKRSVRPRRLRAEPGKWSGKRPDFLIRGAVSTKAGSIPPTAPRRHPFFGTLLAPRKRRSSGGAKAVLPRGTGCESTPTTP